MEKKDRKELIDLLDLKELSDREEFVNVPSTVENSEDQGITLLNWTIEF